MSKGREPKAKEKAGQHSEATRPRLSLRQYCAHRQALGLPCALSTVQEALSSGRIHRTCDSHDRCPTGCRRGKIDPFDADLEWRASTVQSGIDSKKKPKTIAEAQLARLIAQTKLDEQEYQVKKGILVTKDEVWRNMFPRWRAVRDSLLGIPRRVAGQLATETNRKQIERELEAEIRQAMEALSEEFERG